MSIEEFRRMCQAHDLTYSYFDDGRVWQRGHDQLMTIRAAAKGLPPEEVARVWNEVVDSKLAEGARASFYWRG